MSRQSLILQLLSSNHSPTLSFTKQAHASLLKLALTTQTKPTTKLLSLYASHGHISTSLSLLFSLPSPDSFAFSSLSSSANPSSPSTTIFLFSNALSFGLPPDSFFLPSALRAATQLNSLSYGRILHALAFTSGLYDDSFTRSSLLNMYLRCSSLSNAQILFDQIPEPDIVSWSTLISYHARNGDVSETVEFLKKIKSCCNLQPNLVCWNGIVSGFNQSGNFREAVVILKRMHFEGSVLPDGTSVSTGLSAAGDMEDGLIGMQLHGYSVKTGISTGVCVASALVDMYGKCGFVDEMVRVFEEVGCAEVGLCNALVAGLSRNGLVEQGLRAFREFQRQGIDLNVVSWTSIVACVAQNGKGVEALELFREMQTAGIEPNNVTIPCVLPAFSNIAALLHGKSVHCFSMRKGIFEDVYVGSALVDLYSKCGTIKHARDVFDMMKSRNVVSWNAMVGGYAMHGMVREALKMFDLMQGTEQKPDFITYTCVLSACSQAGFTEEGRHHFNQMGQKHGIPARMEHYACMVSLLGRAGKLEQAYNLINQMKFEADACIWGALLNSCRVFNNLELGEIAAEKLFKLEPKNAGNYVLMSNIYASKHMWDGVNRMREIMRSMGLTKEPGCSWMQIKDKVHMLLAGDKSHPQIEEITKKLEQLGVKMKKLGYLPGTDFVLHDVEEYDKEHILCGHSEKLAVALGLISTSPATPIRVIKNLRICGDCHAAIKFISESEGREISVRDTNRFHHFKDGLCSCGDYW